MSRDRTVGDTFYIAFTTRAFATGIPTTLAGSPVVSAYEDASLTQITAGITLGVDHDSVTGLNMLTIVATGANGFETGKDYQLVITTGTVDSVSVVGEVVGQFSLGLSAAAVDLANGTDGLGAIKADTAAILVDTGTTLDGKLDTIDTNVDAILVDTAEIGTAGAGLTDLGGMSTGMKAEVQTEANDALVANNLDHLMAASVAGADVVNNSVVAKLVSASATADWDDFVNTTDSLQAVRDKLTDIETDTAEIGAAGAGLTDLGGMSTTMMAEVESEVNDALVAVGLDHLISASVSGTDVTDNSIIARLVSASATADWDDFVNTTDSLQAIRDKQTDIETDTAAILVDTADMQPKLGTPAADISADIAAVKSETATIVADTNELQTDWANGGRLDLILDARASQTTADAIEADTQNIQSRIPASLSSGNMLCDVAAISGSTEAADNLEASAETIVVGAAVTGTLSTTQMTTDLTEATDDHYNGRIIIWTSGVLQDQATDITDYTGATKLLTFTAVTEAPSNTDTFIIV